MISPFHMALLAASVLTVDEPETPTPTLTTVAIACSNSALQTAYGGRWSPCGIQLNGSHNAANYSTIAFQWRRASGAISGATSINYTPPAGAGFTGLYLRVTVDAGLGTEIVVDSPVTTVAFAKYSGVEGNSDTNAKSQAITNNVGEKIYLTTNYLTSFGLGNLTFEGSGPTAAASHANHLGNTAGVANRTARIFGKSDDDEAQINWQFSAAGGSRSNLLWQIVGYNLTPTVIAQGGDAANSATGATVTVNVPAGGAIISHGGNYDGLTDPVGIQFFDGSAYQKAAAGGFLVGGVGYLLGANAALGVAATKTGSLTNKMHAVFVFTPEVPA